MTGDLPQIYAGRAELCQGASRDDVPQYCHAEWSFRDTLSEWCWCLLLQVIRLFVGDPVWTPINRPCDEHASRQKYLKEVLVA